MTVCVSSDNSANSAQVAAIFTILRCADTPLVTILPVELVQLIVVRCVAGPQDHEQIISLSHVCRSWRSAILGLSGLFVSANWDRWHHEFLAIWCERVGSRPLSIHLHNSKMFESSREDKSASAIVLSSNISRCVTLCIKFDSCGRLQFSPRLLHTSMPLLVNLTEKAPSYQPIDLYGRYLREQDAKPASIGCVRRLFDI